MTQARLPDGRILEFPDGTDPAIIQGAVKRMLGLPEAPVTAAPAPVDQVPSQVPAEQPVKAPEVVAEEAGLVERLGQTLEERTAIKDRIIQQLGTGEISTPSAVLQMVGKVGAGTVSEAIGEAVSSGIDVAGDIISAITPDVIEQPIKEFGASALSTVLNSDLGKAGIAAAEQGFEAYTEFKEEHPEAAGNIEAVVDIGALVGPAKFIKVGKTTKIGKITKEQIENAPSGADLRAESGKLFEATKRSDLNLNQESFLDFMADAEKVLLDQGLDVANVASESLHPKLSRVLNTLSKKIGQDMDAKDLLAVRRRINNAVDSLDKDEQRLALILRDNFDDFVETAPGSDKWRQARSKFAQARRVETIEEAIERAALSPSGIENGLRNEFRSILKNKKKSRGFSKDEKAAMQKVIEGDFTSNTLKKIGKFGVSGGALGATAGGAIGFGAGGGVGALAAPVVTGVASRGATRRTVNAAETLRALAAGETPALIPKTTLSLRDFLAAEAATGLAIAEAGETP